MHPFKATIPEYSICKAIRNILLFIWAIIWLSILSYEMSNGGLQANIIFIDCVVVGSFIIILLSIYYLQSLIKNSITFLSCLLGPTINSTTLFAHNSSNEFLELIKQLITLSKNNFLENTELKNAYHSAQLAQKDDKNTLQHMNVASEHLTKEIIRRTQIEHELNHIKLYLEEILNSIPFLLIAVDEHKKITEWNYQAVQYTQISTEQALGQSVEKILNFIEPSWIDKAFKSGMVEKIKNFPLPKESAAKTYVNINIYPFKTFSIGAVVQVEDVSYQVYLEDLRLHTEKMLSLGSLVTELSHGMHHALGSILQCNQNIERRFDVNTSENQKVALDCATTIENISHYLYKKDIIKLLQGIKESGNFAQGIINSMQQFMHHPKNAPAITSLPVLIDTVIGMLQEEYIAYKKENFDSIVWVKNYNATNDNIYCFPAELKHVFLNVLRNSIEFMNIYKSKFEVQTQSIIDIHTENIDKKIKITIHDNGPGMPEDVRRKVFEPFFTTKEKNQGAGLGLSVAYFIVHHVHKGEITVESSMGHGTKVIIILPIKAES